MSSERVVVIDYGMGNLHSVASALRQVGARQVLVSGDRQQIRSADRVIFPGVGAMRDCMAEIKRLGCAELLPELLSRGCPVLAICIGLQALLSRTEENTGVECLDLVPGEVRFLGDPLQDRQGQRLKVPHMGWNQVWQQRPHPMWSGIEQGSRFYFVHSYYVHARQRELVIGSTEYGVDIDAALCRDNLFAVQFHPEKSHTAGLQLLRNFLSWPGTE